MFSADFARYSLFSLILVGGKEERRLLALASKERLVSILEKMLDEDEFFSEHGIRSYVLQLLLLLGAACLRLPFYSLSKFHKEQPWGIDVNGQRYEVGYWPGDSRSGMFGGNSNWRGPICTIASVGILHPYIYPSNPQGLPSISC